MPDSAIGVFETEVQRLAGAARVPVAAVRGGGILDSAPGWAWVVMDLVPGSPLLGGLSAVAAVREVPRLWHRLPEVLAAASLRVHQCPVDGWDERLAATGRRPGVDAFLSRLGASAEEHGRTELAAAAERLRETTFPETSLCHGDLHPFNVLVDGDRWTLLDWSTAVLADPHYDLAFTELMLSHSPLGGPAPVRRIGQLIGSRLATRFLHRYAQLSGDPIDPVRLGWGRQAHALRAHVEIAGWRVSGSEAAHSGHPWLALEPTLQRELARGAQRR